MTSGVSKATFSPGCTWRLATMPVSGEVATASFSAFCARRTLASADFTLPRVTFMFDSELSNAFCEMKLCFRSFWLDDSVFSAIASCALTDSSWPWRSMSLASRSAVSMRASTWPACTASPFAHGDRADVARHLRLDRRLAHGLQGTRHRQPARQRLALGDGEVGRRELERDRRVLVVVAPFLLFLVDANADGGGKRHRQEDGDRDGDAPPGDANCHGLLPMRCCAAESAAARPSRARPLFGCGARAVWIS